jgi:hypothetical protein
MSILAIMRVEYNKIKINSMRLQIKLIFRDNTSEKSSVLEVTHVQ